MDRLRDHRPGDLGWLLMRQAEMYAQEFGYAPVFEQYVAKSILPFVDGFDHGQDRVWIAERPGAPTRDGDGMAARSGAIAIMHDPDRRGWAKLRWYLVEPQARGAGLGTRLIDEALAFADAAGYEGVHLWTCSDLTAAARQYARTGFRLVEEAPCPWKEGIVQQRYERG